MLIGMKYKSVFFQKYCKSEKEKYFNISVKRQSQRADLVDMFPDSGFFLKRLDVFKFMHTHDSKVRYIISITLTK